MAKKQKVVLEERQGPKGPFYTVLKLVNRLNPKLDESLSEEQVKLLIGLANCQVEIVFPKKKST